MPDAAMQHEIFRQNAKLFRAQTLTVFLFFEKIANINAPNELLFQYVYFI
jgi:hypothetical protein